MPSWQIKREAILLFFFFLSLLCLSCTMQLLFNNLLSLQLLTIHFLLRLWRLRIVHRTLLGPSICIKSHLPKSTGHQFFSDCLNNTNSSAKMKVGIDQTFSCLWFVLDRNWEVKILHKLWQFLIVLALIAVVAADNTYKSAPAYPAGYKTSYDYVII